MAENISSVIITHKIISYALIATPCPQKEKGRRRGTAGLFLIAAHRWATGDYMPEPWMFFQLAMIVFTALSGSGTYCSETASLAPFS